MALGLSYSSQKTNVNQQSSQNLTFNPLISIQSSNPALVPSVSTPVTQTSSLPQSDSPTIPLGLDSLGSLFGGGQTPSIQRNTPNDTTLLGGGTDLFGDNLPLIMIAAGGLLLFMFLGKKKRG